MGRFVHFIVSQNETGLELTAGSPGNDQSC